jgi:hypothetical protein
MAWLFSLSAECGPQKERAEALADHFRGLTITIADGSSYPCVGDTFQDADNNWWGRICPDGVTTNGINSVEEQRQLTEIGFALYERLRSAPAFRYALVGIGVDGIREFSELDDDVVTLDFNGLVLSDAVWQHLGSPGIFVPFAPGYRWRPFVETR